MIHLIKGLLMLWGAVALVYAVAAVLEQINVRSEEASYAVEQ